MELLPFGQISGPLKNKCELKQALLDDQIAPGDQIGRPDFHILVTSKIWSPIWSPEHLVVDLVVVDAVTLSTEKKINAFTVLFGISVVPGFSAVFTPT